MQRAELTSCAVLSPSVVLSLSFRPSIGDRVVVPARRKAPGVLEVVPVGESEKPGSKLSTRKKVSARSRTVFWIIVLYSSDETVVKR